MNNIGDIYLRFDKWLEKKFIKTPESLYFDYKYTIDDNEALKYTSDELYNHWVKEVKDNPEPTITLHVDDSKAMSSTVEVSVYKPLNSIEFKLDLQSGGDRFSMGINNAKELIKYLEDTVAWIENGYKSQTK
jgi:hypothetical protein